MAEQFGNWFMEATEPTPAPQQNPAEAGAWFMQDITPVINDALDKDPDKEARIKHLSEMTGAPKDAIAFDPDAFERGLAADKMNGMLAQAPITQGFITDPDIAAIAHDDVANLVDTEKKWTVAPFRAPLPGKAGKEQETGTALTLDIARAIGAGALYLPYGAEAAGTAVSRFVGADQGQPVFMGQTSAERMQGWRQLIDDTLGEQQSLMPEVSQGIVSAGQTLAALLTKTPLSSMAGSVAGAEAENAAQQGATPGKALTYGAAQGTVEALTEKLPLEHLIKSLKAGSPFFQTLVKQLALENVTEQISTAWQDMNEWLMLNPEKTAGEYMEERPNAALQTLISTTVGASVQTAISTAVVNAVRDDTAKADQAIETADYLDDLKKTYDLSLLRQRAPEVFMQHQVKVLERSGVDTVYIDSDAFAEYGWATDPETGPMALAKQFGLDPEAVDNAITQGTDISLTREQFVRSIMMSEDYADIAPNIRFSPDAMTKRLAEEYKKSGIKEEAERALASKAPVEGAGITVYHGTGHDFLDFSREGTKGTGEGNAAFGDGIYVAEKRGVAEYYKRLAADGGQFDLAKLDEEESAKYDTLVSQRQPIFEQIAKTDKELNDAYEIEREINEAGLKDERIVEENVDNILRLREQKRTLNDQLRQFTREMMEYTDFLRAKYGNGNLFEVTFTAKPGEVLEWDAEIGQQSQELQDRLAKSDLIPILFNFQDKDTVRSIGELPTKVLQKNAALLEKLEAAILNPKDEREALKDELEALTQGNPFAESAEIDEKRAEIKALHEEIKLAEAAYIKTINELYTSVTLNDLTGEDLYRNLAAAHSIANVDSQSLATEHLASLGIVAHKFLDQGSRNKGVGTYNYVIYDPVRLTITKKNDVAIEAIIDLAEQELGLQGLFTSAAEAGMDAKKFQAYLRKVEEARVESIKRQKDKVLKEELRKNDAEWKAEWKLVEEQVKTELGSQQVYQAVNNIQRDRLDQKAIRFTFHELVEKGQTTKEEIDSFLEMLPEDAKGRKLYTPTGQEGIDPQVWAEQHGYDSAIEMLMDMMTVPDFQDAVRDKTQGIMDVKFGSLKDARQALVEARESLHNEDKGDMLTLELNALRGAKKGGSLKPALIRQAARDNMGNMPVKEISPNKFLAAEKREGRKAGMALRRGVYDKATKKWSKSDRKAAADAKFRQVLNFFMAKEAYKAERKLTKDLKYLKKFLNRRKKFPNLPADSLDVIREILADYRLGPKVAAKKKRDLAEWAAKQSSITGTPMAIPPRIAAEDSQKYYKEMKLDDFGELVETIKQIEHAGKTEGQFLDAFRKQGVALTVSDIKSHMLANLKQHKVDRESRLQKEGQLSAYITMVSNADTLLREIDGWEYGVTYDAIKRPYDRAYSEGYHPGQKGFAARDKAISQELTKLFGVFSRKERASMDDKLLVPGVKEPISHAGILSVLLNSGNAANLRALVEPSATAPGMFTMAEVRAIHQYASQKDWDFAQKAWDYLDSFWPEIEEAERRRKGFAPEKVEATPIQTPYGSYRGGYYPLRYDGDVQDVQSKSEIDAFVEQARFGQFVASHTRRGHTVERVGSGGKRVKLDLFVLHSHLHQVAYDLEVGDAINDIYKVLYNPALKQQFTDMGQRSKLEELQLWFGDIVTGELRLNNRLERNLRWLRTGFTVSKLGWNIANALVQPLGLSNTAAIVGKRNTLWALMQVMHNPLKWRGKGSVFQEVMDKSGFMRLRDDTWHKDINDAMDVLSTTWAAKHSPEWLREFGRVSTFLLTKKAQRFADTVTWLAGYRKAIKTNKGNEKQAVEAADRMVARSQSSGIFGERTRLERGTISKNHRQTEVARSFTALASYFLAKTNVTIERTKKLKNPLTHPAQFTNYLIDMALIYVLEGLISSWWYWPDDEEGDGIADDMGWHIAGMALSGIANGLPLIREVSAAAQGYDTGGVIGATAGQAWRAAEQMWQVAKDGPEQFDIHLFKQLNNLGGIFLHYPSSQINRTAGAVSKGASGEETNVLEYVFGVKQND